MNWDWEKLQKKRQKQDGDTPKRPSFGDGNGFNFDFNKLFARFDKSGPPLVPMLVVIVLIWLASGIFIVNPGEEGVVLQFGKYDRTVGPGPHYRLPFPFETTIVVNTQKVRTVDVGVSRAQLSSALLDSGFRRGNEGFTLASKTAQASMFTGDENIVHMQFTVQYSIADARKYLFNVKLPDSVVENAAEAAMREVVGGKEVEDILSPGRGIVQDDSFTILTTILTAYDIGIRLHAVQLGDVYPPTEVEQAFLDVVSARETKSTIENLANAYREEIVLPATGAAKSMENAAEAYHTTTLKKAEGEVARFLLMASEFNKAQDIVKKRMYLETMNEILSSQGIEKLVISKDAQNIMPLYHLGSSGQGLPVLNSANQLNQVPKGGAQ